MDVARSERPHPPSVELEGWGLHSGEPVRVVLSARPPGTPVTFQAAAPSGSLAARIADFVVVSTHRATTVEWSTSAGRLRIATVEHLLAALAGLGIYEGLAIEVDGPELPLLDGGAAMWVEAISRLGIVGGPPPLRVTRRDAIEVGTSRYEVEPGAVPVVQAVFECDDPRLASTATWRGDGADFCRRIAPARTFALATDAWDLLAAGLARQVDPGSVVLVTHDAIHAAGAPFAPDEPARHKLLDLMGDLYLAGGPPCGTVRAVRPGHAANAEACRLALARGLFVRDASRGTT